MRQRAAIYRGGPDSVKDAASETVTAGPCLAALPSRRSWRGEHKAVRCGGDIVVARLPPGFAGNRATTRVALTSSLCWGAHAANAICEPQSVGAWCGSFSQRLPMTVLSRRRFLAASAASAASAGSSAIAAQAPGEFDVVIIGAGAAGIAAARRLAGTKARITVIEASGRV